MYMKVTQDRQPVKENERESMQNRESDRGGQREGGKRWADEITPAGLLALAARVEQCGVP